VTSTAQARTAAALAARRRRTDAMLDRVADAIRHLQRERRPVSFAAVARRAQFTEQGQEFLQLSR
jgi:hypothetical protein